MARQIHAWGFLFSLIGLLRVAPAGAAAAPAGSAAADRAVPFTDPSLFLSPYCWRLDSHGAAICPTGGGYLKFKVTGTSRIGLRVNTAINRGMAAIQMPTVKVVVSGPARDGIATYHQFPPNDLDDTPLAIAAGLDPRLSYEVLIFATGGDLLQVSGWSGTTFQTQLNRLVFDAGAKLAPPLLRPKRALFLGASYEQAYFGLTDESLPMYQRVDASLSWPFFVAYGFDCEYGQVGIGGQGWARPGGGGYPAFPVSWNHFDRAHAKTFGHDLDYVFVHLAENDAAWGDAEVQRAVTAWIPAARAVFGPRTRIFIILSLPQIKSEPIRAGVRAAADARTYLLDPGDEFRRTTFAGGPTWASRDGIHPDAIHQAIFTAFVTRQAQAISAEPPAARR
jgi:hypothetical protein